MIAFFAALQFLTVFPPIVRRPFTARELGLSTAFFPLVGLLLGGLLVASDRLMSHLALPTAVRASLLLAVWLGTTGALHFDGFLDSCDGIFGGRTVEDRLRIMRDEHVGAFAVSGGALLLLTKYASLASMAERTTVLLLAPVLGRLIVTVCVVLFPYARVDGLGSQMKSEAGLAQLAIAAAVTLISCWYVASWRGVIATATALGLAILFGSLVVRRLGGFTGDVYGASCETTEALVLVAGFWIST
ncbi:MAG: adenosylcobinamide-GDP ribazoletransferase [Gemmatales bacterium]|nr:MAG: adenosylcobinamide-GDP ribazoletransferase [Gemmatales bacterium]